MNAPSALALLPALLLGFPIPNRPPADDLAPGELVEGELGMRLDEFLTRLEGVGFAGVAGVEYEGEPLLLRGYGFADRERRTPVTPATVFCTGSITKQFTAAAILVLQDERKLSVQDPLAKHLEHVPEDKRGITLHHLLTHTSGLADPLASDYDPRATAAWVREQAFDAPLEFDPGRTHAYRNVNFSLLAMVIERVSGEPYETFLRRRLFEPAGMQHTGYLLPKFDPASFAIGYRQGDRWGTTLGHPMLADGPCWTLRGNGGIHSTAGDMLRWHHALLEEKLLSPAAHEALETPHVPEGGGSHYAYGWSIQKSPTGGKLVAHNGGNGVFFADFLRFVDDGYCVFIATSVASSMSESLAYDLAAILFGRQPRRIPETLARDETTLAPYAGDYRLGDDSTLTITNAGDRLVLTAQGPDAELALYGETPTPALEPRAIALAKSTLAGNAQEFLASYAGRQSPTSVREELDAARQDWSTRYGTLRSLGPVSTRRNKGWTRIVVTALFERGTGYLMTRWSPAGKVFEFECVDEPPPEGPQPIELFPISPEEFRTYDDREGLGMSVRFELDGDDRPRGCSVGQPPVMAMRE